MKTNAILAGLLISGLIGLSGCDQGATPAAPQKDQPKTSQSAPVPPAASSAPQTADTAAQPGNLLYVKLNVPHMT